MTVQAPTDLTGKQIGKYRLVSRIAQGGSGTVYKGRTAEDKFAYAVKVLNPELVGNKKAASLMAAEYEICRSLRNSRIVKYFDFGNFEDRPYIVMEYFPAHPLAKIIKNKEAVRTFRGCMHEIIQHMAEALAYIHLQGVIHRDIKADNFLVNLEKKSVRLIDFSTAVKARRGIISLLSFRKPDLAGTPSYMAPEQINRERPAISSDIYSFGAMLFEIFAGQPPFTGNNQNEVLNKILKKPAPLISHFDSGISPDFDKLVKNMLAKSPEQRPHSMEHFLSSFSRISIYPN